MELDKIISLIREVSNSTLTGFVLEEGNMHLELTKGIEDAEKEKVVQEKLEENEKNESDMNVQTIICSPLVGTFYRAPSETEAPFVKVGDYVEKGQVLGIIEAMKLMNEIEAEASGVITKILVENEQMVEYGQPLFYIEKKKG